MMGRIARAACERELELARAAHRAGELDIAFRHLERAHILGQRVTGLHVRSHVAMLGVGWQRRDTREIVGQCS